MKARVPISWKMWIFGHGSDSLSGIFTNFPEMNHADFCRFYPCSFFAAATATIKKGADLKCRSTPFWVFALVNGGV
jgi:hypothetical protein